MKYELDNTIKNRPRLQVQGPEVVHYYRWDEKLPDGRHASAEMLRLMWPGTQQELADSEGVSLRAVSGWFAGENCTWSVYWSLIPVRVRPGMLPGKYDPNVYKVGELVRYDGDIHKVCERRGDKYRLTDGAGYRLPRLVSAHELERVEL